MDKVFSLIAFKTLRYMLFLYKIHKYLTFCLSLLNFLVSPLTYAFNGMKMFFTKFSFGVPLDQLFLTNVISHKRVKYSSHHWNLLGNHQCRCSLVFFTFLVWTLLSIQWKIFVHSYECNLKKLVVYILLVQHSKFYITK